MGSRAPTLPADASPFAAFTAQHGTALRSVARRLTGSADEAEDLVQDALERAMKNFDRRGADDHGRAWVLTILHNLFIDRCRRLRREGVVVSIDDLPVAAPEPAGPEPAWATIGVEDVRAALADLGDEFRVVYEMHALERKSYVEIAETLGVPKATVGTRLLRARQKLKVLLATRSTR